jgi:hypothetical protein
MGVNFVEEPVVSTVLVLSTSPHEYQLPLFFHESGSNVFISSIGMYLMEVMNTLIQEMEELTNDVRMEISVDKTIHEHFKIQIAAQNTKTKIYNLKSRISFRKNIQRYQHLNMWFHWLLIRTVEKMSSKNNSRQLILSGSLTDYEMKIYISQDTKLKICTTVIKPIVL